MGNDRRADIHRLPIDPSRRFLRFGVDWWDVLRPEAAFNILLHSEVVVRYFSRDWLQNPLVRVNMFAARFHAHFLRVVDWWWMVLIS